MMLGSKGLLTPLIPDCSALRALTILKNIRNPLIFLRKMASYSCFWRVPRLKIFMQASLHQISNLLTLVSCNENMRIKKIWLLRRKETMVIKLAVPNQFRLKMVPTFKSVFLQKEGEVHYIGGADILPAPLGSKEEAEVLKELGTERDAQAKSKLIEHNLRLVVYIAKKFDNTSVGVEDLISIGSIGLIKAINTFNIDKNIKLATYASRCIENEILMYLRRNNKTKMEVSIDEPLNVDWDGNELLLSDILGTDEDVIYRDLEDEIEKSLLNTAISRLNPREQKIVELRFGLGTENEDEMTQKEVADLLGISQSYISRLEKKIMKRLKKEIVKYE